jgi:hypothetical protein
LIGDDIDSDVVAALDDENEPPCDCGCKLPIVPDANDLFAPIPDPVEDENGDPFVYCERHRRNSTIVDEGTSIGFGGGRIYWATLACGCQLHDESDDVRAAY